MITLAVDPSLSQVKLVSGEPGLDIAPGLSAFVSGEHVGTPSKEATIRKEDVTGLRSRVDEMAAQIESLKERVNVVEAQNVKLQGEIAKLRKRSFDRSKLESEAVALMNASLERSAQELEEAETELRTYLESKER